jgi:hypothetical protein
MSQVPGQDPEHDDGRLQTAERGAWIRYPRRLQTIWQMFGAHGNDSWAADLHDISRTGIGLVLDRAFPPATVLTVRLQTTTRKTTMTMLARVRHCSALPCGKRLVGCTFVVQLKDEELREVVSDPALPAPQSVP